MLYRQRFLRAVSVGFRAKAFVFRKGRDGSTDGVEYTKQELLEVSAVPVPANPMALAKALDGGLSLPRMRGLMACRQADVSPDQARAVVASLREMRERLSA